MNVGKPSISKRVLSASMDLVLIFLFTTLFMFGIFYTFINPSIKYQTASEKYKSVHVDSHLFTLENNELKVIKDNYDENLSYCFEKYNSLDLYNEHKDSSGLFLEDGSFENSVTVEEAEKFFIKEVNFAVTNLIQKDSVYTTSYLTIIRYQTSAIVASAILSTLIFELIIPMCLKNGKTIGKLFTHQALVSSDGYKVKKKNIVIRYFAYALVNVFLGVISYGIILIFSFFIVCFNYRGMSIHDYISSTVVVDDLNYIILENKNGGEILKNE